MRKSVCHLIVVIFLILPVLLFPISLQKKLETAQVGDYIVTAQDGHYSLLFIRTVQSPFMHLEEITVPESFIDLSMIQWQQWVMEKAPGHTAWTLYEIDLSRGVLERSFSYSKNGWQQLSASEQFFFKLLTLPLREVGAEQRKKIGPRPHGEEDRRPLWIPSVIVKGKKMAKPDVQVLSTQWPDDGSPLALSAIDLYFDVKQPNFPFPYWIEVKSSHYSAKIRAVDSGIGLVSAQAVPNPLAAHLKQ